ncbi:maleylpyruvate isomerase N-terminal domain-containing protein, partial [Streptomyces anulatus]|uniref:maleylpyruvate isomerase N-terminal domain-containing protein n=1 Tax=Streptomyces anulatus TaxID=1892 RepID=UPI003F4D39BD
MSPPGSSVNEFPAVHAAGPVSPGRTCPGWQIRHLLRHTGMVHRWAAALVAEGHTT